MTRVFLCTNGCVEGQLRTKLIERYLDTRRPDVLVTPELSDADTILFYACGLTDEKENHSLDLIRELKAKMQPDADFIVWGCLAKQNPQVFAGLYDGPLAGPLDIALLAGIPGAGNAGLDTIDHSAAGSELKTMAAPTIHGCTGTDLVTRALLLYKRGVDLLSRRRMRRSPIYYIPISVGCTGHCTYCSERPAFGNTIHSRPIDQIVSEFQSAMERGYARFSLVATDLGSYGADIGCRLPDLLTGMLDADPSGNCSLLLNQIEPHHLRTIYDAMEPAFDSGRIEMVMSPVQSGSDRILKLMGRHYTAGQWRALMMDIHRNHPGIRLNTQFMVGFPSETEEDFAATLDLLDPPFRLDELHIFRFSPRSIVPASRFPDQVSDEVKEARAERLLSRFARSCI